MEQKIIKFFDGISCFFGAIITALTTVFGWQWIVFAGYLIFNIIDWITGWLTARKKGTESSRVGLKGVLKKISYWVLILVAFLAPFLITKISISLGINLDFLMFFGWFTLACLLVNEVRSVLENLVLLGVKVPAFLTKGLNVAQDLVDKTIDKLVPENTEK